VISITATYKPIVPIVPLPPIPMTFVAAHTIFTTIIGPTPTPRPNPDLMISKVGVPDHILPGESTAVTYTIQITNTGPVAASAIVVTDTLPTGMNPISVTVVYSAPWNCPSPHPTSSVFTCTMPFLGSFLGANVSLPIVLHATAPMTPGLLTNVARVGYNLVDPQPSNNVATANTFIATWIDLALHKVALVDPVAAGSNITYELSVTNLGWVTAATQTVTDTLPVDKFGSTLTLVSPPSGSSWTCLGSSVIICNSITPLPVGSTSPTITVVLVAPNPGFVPSGGYLTNVATAASQLGDPYPINNTNIVVTTSVTTDADMAMFKSGPLTANGGSIYTYVMHVTNNGPSVATGVRITDTLPSGTIYGSYSGASWTCPTTGSTVGCLWALGSVLAVGASTSDLMVTVQMPVADAALANTASGSSAQSDPYLTNNTATVTTTVNSCHHDLVNAGQSSVSASPTDVFADNASTSRILVTLRDACANVLTALSANPQQVTLTSSRGALDTVTLAPGFNNPTSNGQVAFDVKSGTPGTSTYSASARDTVTNATVNLTPTAQVNFYGCVGDSLYHLGERPLGGGGQKFLQFVVDNNSGLTRHLTGVNLTWPQSGGRKVQSLTLAATTLWSGPSSNNPFQIPSALNWIAGTDPARTLSSGTVNQTLQFDFSFAVASSGAYNLTTTWDDGSGGHICTATISVTH